MTKQGEAIIRVFGFGSLINLESLKATAHDSHNVQAGYIKGFYRSFSLWDPIGWTETNTDLKGIPFCALDIQRIKDSSVKTNGIIFQVSQSSFEKLKQREREYQLIQTSTYDFVTDKLIGNCWVFSAGKNNGAYVFDSEAQNRYLQVCLDGASHWGEQFYEEFLNSTFIDNHRLKSLASKQL